MLIDPLRPEENRELWQRTAMIELSQAMHRALESGRYLEEISQWMVTYQHPHLGDAPYTETPGKYSRWWPGGRLNAQWPETWAGEESA